MLRLSELTSEMIRKFFPLLSLSACPPSLLATGVERRAQSRFFTSASEQCNLYSKATLTRSEARRLRLCHTSPRCGQARRSKGGARNTGIYFKQRSAQKQHAPASNRGERTRGGGAHVTHGRPRASQVSPGGSGGGGSGGKTGAEIGSGTGSGLTRRLGRQSRRRREKRRFGEQQRRKRQQWRRRRRAERKHSKQRQHQHKQRRQHLHL